LHHPTGIFHETNQRAWDTPWPWKAKVLTWSVLRTAGRMAAAKTGSALDVLRHRFPIKNGGVK